MVAPNTAGVFILYSISILLLGQGAVAWRRILSRIISAFALAFSAATLSEYIFNINLGIDTVFFHHRMMDWSVPSTPGRFAVQAAFGFTFFGIALLLTDVRIGRIYTAEPFTALAIIPPGVALLGYVYKAGSLHGVISLATITLFVFSWTGLLLLRPHRGITSLILSMGSGGLAARQLIFAATIVLTASGWLYLRLRTFDLVDREYGIALLVAADLLAFTALIISTARKLERFDRERDRANDEVAQALREKQATEERLNRGLEAARAATWDHNLRTNEFYWSRGHYLLLGYKVGEVRPSLEAWKKRIHPEDLDAITRTYADSVHNGTPFAGEYRVVWPDGTVHWLETKGNLILDELGEPSRSIGGFIEITDRKRAQQALMEAEKLAATGRMAASLAHEINNPLAAVTNLIYLLKSDNAVASEAAQQFLQVADDEIRRVAQLVQKTLSFYRSDAQSKTIVLSDLIDDVIWLYKRRIKDFSIEVDKRADFTGPMVCNSGEIRQVFTNLFVNAIDAVGTGGKIVVHITAGHDWNDSSKSGARVFIFDNGSGIPAEQRPQLFTPFFSMKGDRGTGLGLWISKGIMEKNGGWIRFRSRTSKPAGTVFYVFIPNHAQASADQLPQSIATSA